MNLLIDIDNKQLIFNGQDEHMITDKNNNPWFKGNDVGKTLVYERPRKAVYDHVKNKHNKISGII